MANLKIPERYRPGMSVIANLAESAYQEILSAAQRAPSAFTSNLDLATWLASEVKGVLLPDVTSLVDTVTSLYRVRTRPGVTAPQLAADVAIAVVDIPNFKIADGVDFGKRLSSLLEIEYFNIVAGKAKELQMSSERTWCDARVLTDVRPVFGDRASSAPTAMIVIHTLKIGFHDSGRPGHREFYIALDEADIVELKKTLERAEEKASSVKAFLGKTGIPQINLS